MSDALDLLWLIYSFAMVRSRGRMSVTSVQITRETSRMLDDAAKASGLRKGYLADTAIRFFLDPEKNPEIAEALKNVNHVRENALEQAMRSGRARDEQQSEH